MFVTFEGPEGAGKSTVMRAIATRLSASGHPVVTTREPGGSRIGPTVRSLLLDGDDLAPTAELFLFLADRAQHVRDLIAPRREDSIVLCDRYMDSTFVYQSVGRGLPAEFVRAANLMAIDGHFPDVTYLLDLPAEVGLARIANPDRLDREPVSFHQRVRDGFLALASTDPRFTVVDAHQDPARVAELVWADLHARLASTKFSESA